MVDEFGSESLSRIFYYGIEGLFTRDFLFYFTNRSGDHHHHPFTVGLLTYAIVFYVLFDMTARSSRRFTRGEILMPGLTATGVLSAYRYRDLLGSGSIAVIIERGIKQSILLSELE